MAAVAGDAEGLGRGRDSWIPPSEISEPSLAVCPEGWAHCSHGGSGLLRAGNAGGKLGRGTASTFHLLSGLQASFFTAHLQCGRELHWDGGIERCGSVHCWGRHSWGDLGAHSLVSEGAQPFGAQEAVTWVRCCPPCGCLGSLQAHRARLCVSERAGDAARLLH